MFSYKIRKDLWNLWKHPNLEIEYKNEIRFYWRVHMNPRFHILLSLSRNTDYTTCSVSYLPLTSGHPWTGVSILSQNLFPISKMTTTLQKKDCYDHRFFPRMTIEYFELFYKIQFESWIQVCLEITNNHTNLNLKESKTKETHTQTHRVGHTLTVVLSRHTPTVL